MGISPVEVSWSQRDLITKNKVLRPFQQCVSLSPGAVYIYSSVANHKVRCLKRCWHIICVAQTNEQLWEHKYTNTHKHIIKIDAC